MDGYFIRVPKGSLFGLLVFNMSLCNLFLFFHDILVANYVDDNTTFCTSLKTSNIFIEPRTFNIYRTIICFLPL